MSIRWLKLKTIRRNGLLENGKTVDSSHVVAAQARLRRLGMTGKRSQGHRLNSLLKKLVSVLHGLKFMPENVSRPSGTSFFFPLTQR
jgi:hypothetical protein